MASGTQTDTVAEQPAKTQDVPEISVCESSPDRVVFLETGNTDAWIASDVAVDVPR